MENGKIRPLDRSSETTEPIDTKFEAGRPTFAVADCGNGRAACDAAIAIS